MVNSQAGKVLPAVLLCAALVAGLAGCAEQRSPVRPKPPFSFVTASDLFAVHCSGQNVWVVGFDACIYHSGDGGETWQEQHSGVDVNLCDVTFIDSRNGWISGRAGTMLRTGDGGATWTPCDTGTTNHLFALHFVDNSTGWAVGNFGTIVHTTDGGRTWTDQGSGEDRIYNDVFFVSATTGWIAAEYGLIYHTDDGGATWQQQECPDIIPVVDETQWESFPPSLYGVCFRDAAHGWITGMDGTIITTVDGGATWTKMTNPAEASEVTLYCPRTAGDRVCVVGQKGTCLVLDPPQGLWQDRSAVTDTKFWLRDMHFGSPDTGFAVGSRGTILRTTDGGTTWEMLSGIPLSLNETAQTR